MLPEDLYVDESSIIEYKNKMLDQVISQKMESIKSLSEEIAVFNDLKS